MSCTIFKDINFKGIYSSLGAGNYAGKQLTGCQRPPYDCIPINNEINSIRVEDATVVNISSDLSYSNSRVLIGPIDIPDVASIGMTGSISYIQVVHIQNTETYVPNVIVDLYSDYDYTGRQYHLTCGTHNKARLSGVEFNMTMSPLSINVPDDTMVVLYTGTNYDSDKNSVLIVGPKKMRDLSRITINSIVVKCFINRHAQTAPQPTAWSVLGQPQYGQPQYGQPQYGTIQPVYQVPKKNNFYMYLVFVSIIMIACALYIYFSRGYQKYQGHAQPRMTTYH
jgi:hypothetical protein